jgi:hypothetical protein
MTVPPTYAAAVAYAFAASKSRVSTAYAENVVNPPSTPVPKNGRV